jgi:hypothetical protein
LIRLPPSVINSPSASTTSSPGTWSVVTPYFTQQSPPALVAMLPPIEQISYEDGSGGYHRPCAAAAAFTSALNGSGLLRSDLHALLDAGL